MKFRIISFTVAVTVMAAIVACGPNKKRDTAINRAKNAATNGKTDPAQDALDSQPLSNLADGKATFQESCANPIAMQIKASEKELTAESLKSLGATSYSLTSIQMHSVHTLNGTADSVTGTVTGPLDLNQKTNDSAAKVVCHTSKAPEKGKQAQNSGMIVSMPAQLVSGKASSAVKVILQAMGGKAAGRAQIVTEGGMSLEDFVKPIEAPKEAKVTRTAVTDTDNRILVRNQLSMSAEDGSTTVWTWETIYTPAN